MAVQIYAVAKTIADIFKFKNTFGLDVAIEALKEGWREKLRVFSQLPDNLAGFDDDLF